MRLLLLTVLFISFTITSHARELTSSETRAIKPLDSSNMIFEYMVANTNIGRLSIKDRLYFQILKKSCYPVNAELENIAEDEADEEADNSKLLKTYMAACKEGVFFLTKLYVQYQ